MNTIQCIPIVVAGGRGTRMGGQIRKQYLMLDNLPVLVRTMDVFDRHPHMACTVVVVPEKDMDLCRTQIIQPRKFFHPVYLTPGGSHRQQSVRNGVQKALVLADDPQQTLVLIHDGVRPFVSGKLLDQLTHTAIHSGGCIPVLPVTDTLKQVDDQNRIIATVDRKGLFQAQTPQVFRLDRISRALEHAEATGFIGTDDASVMTHAGYEVTSVPGDPANIKLTTPHDLVLARHLILTQTV